MEGSIKKTNRNQNQVRKQNCKQKLLLHSCCGPCSTAVIDRLANEYDITVYFYNPNITDREEYQKRKESQIRFIELYNCGRNDENAISFIEGPYDPNNFYVETKGLEKEPEGGRRCEKCFMLRMKETANIASRNNYQCFGTTLSVSPHKNNNLISRIGQELESILDVSFLDEDFKKKAGFQRSVQMSKEYELYRQVYCGCEFSK